MASASSPAGDRLGDVAAGAGPDHVDDVLGGVGHRQRQEHHLRAAPAWTCSSTARAAAVGHVHVQQHDVRAIGGDPGDRLAHEPASPTTGSGRRPGRPSSALTPVRNSAWSSTRNTVTGAVGAWRRPARRCIGRRVPGRLGPGCRRRSRRRRRSASQLHLGALARACDRTVDRAAVPVHPAPGWTRPGRAGRPGPGSGSNPTPRSRTNTCAASVLDLGVDADLGDAGVLGRVDHRLAGGGDQRGRCWSIGMSPTTTGVTSIA